MDFNPGTDMKIAVGHGAKQEDEFSMLLPEELLIFFHQSA